MRIADRDIFTVNHREYIPILKSYFVSEGEKMRIIESEKVRNIYVSLNYHCNNNCLMCGVPFYKHNKYNNPLSFYIDEIEKVPFDIEPDDIITISGGEPFLFSGIWELLDYIKKNLKCRIVIFTNGRALKDREVVKRLVDYRINKLVIPFFSYKEDVYDTIAGAKNAFQEVSQALCNLNETNLYHEVKYLPMKQNAEDIKDSYLYVKEKYKKTTFTICGVQYFGEAVNNSKIIGIKYSDLKNELEETFDVAIERYGELIPLYRFPMCVLDPIYWRNGVLTLFQEYIIGPDYSDVNLSDDKKKSLQCQCLVLIA